VSTRGGVGRAGGVPAIASPRLQNFPFRFLRNAPLFVTGGKSCYGKTRASESKPGGNAVSDFPEFAPWLEGRIIEVRRIEEDALLKLAAGDSAGYGAAMRDKAELLAALPKEAPLASLPPEIRENARSRIWDFARNAATALSLNSVFYMSALLYPDDHRKGEPNNLERFLEELRAAR
jgi:hypothetical protein